MSNSKTSRLHCCEFPLQTRGMQFGIFYYDFYNSKFSIPSSSMEIRAMKLYVVMLAGLGVVCPSAMISMEK